MTRHAVGILGGQQFSRASSDGGRVHLVKIVHKQPKSAVARAIELRSITRQQVDEEEVLLSVGAELKRRVVGVVGMSDGLFLEAEGVAVEGAGSVEVVDGEFH